MQVRGKLVSSFMQGIKDYTILLNEEQSTLLESKLKLEHNSNQKSEEEAIIKLQKSLNAYLDFNELTPQILHRFIDKIEIKADGSPRIHYRFSNPLQLN